MTVWILPVLLIVVSTAVAVPLAYFIAWIMDGKYKAPRWLRWLEARVDTGPQTWKQYTVALLLTNTMMFVFGFLVLWLQPYLTWLPFNSNLGDNSHEALAPGTIFNTAISFFTNTNWQDYSGEVHFTYCSQIFFVIWNMFLSASVGVCTLMGIIRALRGDKTIGNFYLDMWRSVMYLFLPLAFVTALPLMAAGVPMTMENYAQVKNLDTDSSGGDQSQTIARGPVAALMTIKHLGTNGGGFFGANSAHPFENPNAWTDFLEIVSFMAFPFALVFTYGKMLRRMKHAVVIYCVMLFMMLCMVGNAVYFDSVRPNPGLTGEPQTVYNKDDPAKKIELAEVPPLPVDQNETGNLEGKELRFGRSGGATFATMTTAISCGSVNCMHDSLNPMAGLTPFTGMWLNCVFGGKGVGVVNMLVYIIVAVFIAGLMVGRTPEYLGKKIEAREMKLAMVAMLIHPIIIILPAGICAAFPQTAQAETNPSAHGFSQILYAYSSCAANNGSAFGGLGATWGFNNPKAPPNAAPAAPAEPYLDVAMGITLLLGRFIPVVAPLALAGGLIVKKPTPFTVGTLRTDTLTFGLFLLGTILLVGALLFMPAAMLGPVAEHLGPMPFGN
ncbi:MAG TPA: potassium-transporting ATPase subunit KdpA [Gemmataceae bacterium]|nr:potassium-transporting ATPase subunit KdpA [Gemmataceae bacterium]